MSWRTRISRRDVPIDSRAGGILSQRQIYRLRPDARARLNTVYMGSAFLGGAAGSAIAGALQGPYGWTGVTLFGVSISAVAFLLWVWRRGQAQVLALPR
jgi:predicted MFS family arabinose efflux permease